jgi:hypothetical protein
MVKIYWFMFWEDWIELKLSNNQEGKSVQEICGKLNNVDNEFYSFFMSTFFFKPIGNPKETLWTISCRCHNFVLCNIVDSTSCHQFAQNNSSQK